MNVEGQTAWDDSIAAYLHNVRHSLSGAGRAADEIALTLESLAEQIEELARRHPDLPRDAAGAAHLLALLDSHDSFAAPEAEARPPDPSRMFPLTGWNGALYAGAAVLAGGILLGLWAVLAGNVSLLSRATPPASLGDLPARSDLPAAPDRLDWRDVDPNYKRVWESYTNAQDLDVPYYYIMSDHAGDLGPRRLVVVDLRGQAKHADFEAQGYGFWEVVLIQPDFDRPGPSLDKNMTPEELLHLGQQHAGYQRIALEAVLVLDAPDI